MARYLIRATYTAEGARGVLKEGGSSRRSMIEQAVRKLGGTLEAFYFAFGEDVVLLTPEEIDEAARKSVEYRPPGA